MELDTGAYGAKAQRWRDANPRDLLKKMIADSERLGKKPSEDPQIVEFYNASPGLATFYERDGSRRTKYVSPQRKAIEQDLLWGNTLLAAAREKETLKLN